MRFGCPVERPTPARRRASDNVFYRAPLERCTACPSVFWPRSVGWKASGRYYADGSPSFFSPTPQRNRRTLRFADDLHSSLPRIGKSGRCIRSLLRKNIAWSLINGTYDRLTAVTYGDLANS